MSNINEVYNDMFRSLRADEVEVRLSRLKGRSKEDSTGAYYLLYKDARCDMRILDETFGPFRWQRDHKQVKDNVYCGVSIYAPEVVGVEGSNKWITKWDAGDETDVEKAKGEASDSFKRACFNWGIGRELYTAPIIEIPFEGDWEMSNKRHPGLKVTEMEVIDHRITKLVISDNRRVRFTWKDSTPEIKQRIDQCSDVAELTKLWNELTNEEQSNNKIRSYFTQRRKEVE